MLYFRAIVVVVSFRTVSNQLTYKNQGMLYNNATLGYYRKTIAKLNLSNHQVFEQLN